MPPPPDRTLPGPDPVVARLRAAGCVFAEDEARLLAQAADDPPALDVLVARRVAGEPLEHLLGWVEFRGLRLTVMPGVFVPRTRTVVLAEQALAAVRDNASAVPVVVDLCCGSGAVGAVLLATRPHLRLHAADLEPAAVRCARRNLPGAAVHQGDLYDALPPHLRGRVDVLLANAPYVPTDAIALMPPEAREHEPRTALDGGADGLDVLRRVIADAPAWLAPGGVLLVECSAEQAPALAAAVRQVGLHSDVRTDDERGGTVLRAAQGRSRQRAFLSPARS